MQAIMSPAESLHDLAGSALPLPASVWGDWLSVVGLLLTIIAFCWAENARRTALRLRQYFHLVLLAEDVDRDIQEVPLLDESTQGASWRRHRDELSSALAVIQEDDFLLSDERRVLKSQLSKLQTMERTSVQRGEEIRKTRNGLEKIRRRLRRRITESVK
jgi:hypothetical protein